MRDYRHAPRPIDDGRRDSPVNGTSGIDMFRSELKSGLHLATGCIDDFNVGEKKTVDGTVIFGSLPNPADMFQFGDIHIDNAELNWRGKSSNLNEIQWWGSGKMQIENRWGFFFSFCWSPDLGSVPRF